MVRRLIPVIVAALVTAGLSLAQRTAVVTPRVTTYQDTVNAHTLKDTTGGARTVIVVAQMVDSSAVQSLISDSMTAGSLSPAQTRTLVSDSTAALRDSLTNYYARALVRGLVSDSTGALRDSLTNYYSQANAQALVSDSTAALRDSLANYYARALVRSLVSDSTAAMRDSITNYYARGDARALVSDSTAALRDSLTNYYAQALVRSLVSDSTGAFRDSLNNYLPTAEIRDLASDSTAALRDSLNNYWDSQRITDTLTNYATVADTHDHGNKATLDAINDAGSGDIITSAERDSLHEHGNRDTLDAIAQAGSGQIITDTERTKMDGVEAGADVTDSTNVATAIKHELDSLVLINRLVDSLTNQATLADTHEHSNKAILDVLTDAGSGSVITDAERDSVHEHGNRDTLDAIAQAGSGQIITDAERTKLNGIEASADVTDSVNVGTVIGHELDSLAAIADMQALVSDSTAALRDSLANYMPDAVVGESLATKATLTQLGLKVDSTETVSAGSGVTINGKVYGDGTISLSGTGGSAYADSIKIDGVNVVGDSVARLAVLAESLANYTTLADTHEHSNKAVLDLITNEGSGEVITAAERDSLHEHGNRDTLDAITKAGSGEIITNDERDSVHAHTNKDTLDAIPTLAVKFNGFKGKDANWPVENDTLIFVIGAQP